MIFAVDYRKAHGRGLAVFFILATHLLALFCSIGSGNAWAAESGQWDLTEEADFWAGVDSLEALVRSNRLDDLFAEDSLLTQVDSSFAVSDSIIDILTDYHPQIGMGQDSASRELVLITGYELTGIDETFGAESLQPIGSSSEAIDIASGLDDQLEEIRFQDTDTDHLGIVNLRGHLLGHGPVDTWVDLEGKAGGDRGSVAAEGSLRGRSGRWRSFSCRNLFVWDKEHDSYTNGQNAFLLKWRRKLSGQLRLGLRGDYDRSWTSGADIIATVPSSETDDADSSYTIDSGFLNYHKAALRFRLSSLSLNSTSLTLALRRKWVDDGGSGSYESILSELNRDWLYDHGFLNAVLGFERRFYHQSSTALRSNWEIEGQCTWQGKGGSWYWRGYGNLTGTLYDDLEEQEDDLLLSIEEDRCQIEAEAIFYHRFGGVPDLPLSNIDEKLELGVGPWGELIRCKHRHGDSDAIALKSELSYRRHGKGLGLWTELSCEAGRRVYFDSESNRLIIEGFSLSLSQSNFNYFRTSLMAGGGLTRHLEWDGYISLDQEWHSIADDNARFISFSFSLKYHLGLIGVD